MSQKYSLEILSVVWDCLEPRQTVGVMSFGAEVLSSGKASLAAVLANLDTTSVGDAGSTRTVLFVSVALVLAAFLLIGVTIWFWRNTVPDPDALESLAFFEERVVDGTEEIGTTEKRRRRSHGESAS